MGPTTKILLVAVAAGALGVVAGLLTTGPGPLLRTELGQRVLNDALTASAPAPEALAIATRGGRVPSFELPGLDGRRVRIPEAWAGRTVLVNVWASWCGPCREEMPALQQFSVEQGTNGVQVVGIALDEADAVRAFLAQTPVGYPILLDAPGPTDAGV